MKSMKCFCLVGLLLWSNIGVAQACAGPPEPIYAPPPYIDPGYAPIEWSDVDYGPTAQFMLLMQDYAESKNSNKDDAQDYFKQQEEKNSDYANAIAELLKSKNIAPTTIDAQGFDGCGSNSHENVLLFLRTVFDDPSVKDGFADFAKIRHRMLGLCDRQNREALSRELSGEITELQQKNNTGEYADYLAVLQTLYGDTGDIDNDKLPEALVQLQKIQEKTPKAPPEKWWSKYIGGQPRTWMHQTASYLIARMQLIMSQKDWDGETDPPAINKEKLEEAKKSFADYLQNYPNGFYADSAKNIQRRVMYLEGNRDALDKAVEDKINEAFDRRRFSNSDLETALKVFAEYKRYYKGDSHVDQDVPLVIAYGLFRARDISPSVLGQLQGRKNDFSAYPGLFRFLQAYVLYREHEYQKLLDLTPYEIVNASVLSLSTEAIRARAFEAAGKKDQALQAWQNVASVARDDQSQLHIAGLYVGNNDAAGLFSEKSGLSNNHVLSDFGVFGLSNEQLWAVLKLPELKPENRLIAAKALFQRLLLQRRYSDIEKLVQQNSYQDAFKDITDDVVTLSQAPNDPTALVKVGAYIYEHYLRPNSSIYAEYSPFSSDAVKEIQSVCPSCQAVQNAIPPMSNFLKAEEVLQKNKQRAEIEAQNLHFLVKCFHQSEFADRCQWGQSFDNQGKTWFDLLHKKYPRSEWAEKTPYYY